MIERRTLFSLPAVMEAVVLSGATLLSLELLAVVLGGVPEPTALMALVVVYCAYSRGMPAGLVSAGIGVLFSALEGLTTLPVFPRDSFLEARVSVTLFTLPILAVAVGYLRREAFRRVQSERVARSAAEKAEARYRSLVNGIHAVIWQGDAADFRIDFVSQQAVERFGYPAEDWLAPGFWDRLIHPDDHAAVRAAREEATRTGSDYEAEFRVCCSDGEERWVRNTVHLDRDRETGRMRARGVMSDITERKELEEQLRQSQKMEAVGRLAGGVAHDFNNLLTAMKGHGELLLQAWPTEDPQRADLEEILRSADRAAALTRQLLAFSRQQIFTPEVLDMNGIVADVERMLMRLIGEHVRLETRLEATGAVRGDRGQIEQVLMNLVVNARDAMPEGGSLTVTTSDLELPGFGAPYPAVAPGRYVRLRVQDTGHGMDAETLARIFDPFFTTKPPGQGSGLGLSTAYGIANQSGGYLIADSEPGGGATFDLILPRTDEHVPISLPAAGDGDGGAVLGGTETVLVVEDEAGVRSLVSRVLRKHGYQVIEAPDGEEALRVASRARQLDLLLSDIVMPGMRGPELARRLAPSREGMRVLFMSGYTDDAILRLGDFPVEAEFLSKPFTPSEIARKVREVLDQALPPSLAAVPGEGTVGRRKPASV